MKVDLNTVTIIISIVSVGVNIFLVFYKRYSSLASVTKEQAQEIKNLREEIEKSRKLLMRVTKRNKKHMSWTQYYAFVDSMVNQIFADKRWVPDWVVAVDGGGLAAAGLLVEDYRFRSEFEKIVKVVVVNIQYERKVGQNIVGTLNLRGSKEKGKVCFAPDSPELPNFNNTNVLIVDAQINSGATLKFLREQVLNHGAREVKTAVAIKRPSGDQQIQPDFVGGIHKLSLPRFHF